ncbi:MAG: hypothetical protein Q9159_004784 [Coniocarpon cinnabarinum]
MSSSLNVNARHELILGTRNSKLALTQCNIIKEFLTTTAPELKIRLEPIQVRGDADKQSPFLQMISNPNGAPNTTLKQGSDLAKDLWTHELDEKLISRDLDAVVHSLKDLPTLLPEDTTLAAYVKREDPRDALVMRYDLPYRSLNELPEGFVVGTSAIRRKALMRRHYPELVVQECRGNVDTRLAKLDASNSQYSCVILAAAGLRRMGLEHRITAYLSATEFPYAAGQGALTVQIRTSDESTRALMRPLDHTETRLQCLAERALLRTLQGGCSSPVGVWSHSRWREQSESAINTADCSQVHVLELGGVVVTPSGLDEVRYHASACVDSDADAEELGVDVAGRLLAAGGGEVLKAVQKIEARECVHVDWQEHPRDR